MNGEIKVMREIPKEWDAIMRLAEILRFGEIEIKIHEGKPTPLADLSIGTNTIIIKRKVKIDSRENVDEALKTIQIL